jgi:uncharacterized Fe-S center protein
MPARKSTRTRKTSAVYFAPAALTDRRGPYRAIEALFRKVVAKDTIAKGDYVAIKLHFGEEANVRYIRPTYIRRLADLVEQAGGHPFATDTLTLYKRRRHTLFGHLDLAAEHGFTRETLGCPVLIADGLRSTGVEVPVPDPLELDSCVVGQAIYDADVLINVAHLTLHDEIPLAAAMKNIGMGCVTRETKLRCHGTGVHPNFDSSRCVLCGHCLRMCPGDAFTLKRRKIHFDESLCVSCGDCFAWCEGGALDIPWGAETQIVQRRTCDAARGVLATFARRPSTSSSPWTSPRGAIVSEPATSLSCPTWASSPPPIWSPSTWPCSTPCRLLPPIPAARWTAPLAGSPAATRSPRSRPVSTSTPTARSSRSPASATPAIS